MGGNALKNCTTRRYSSSEYFQLEYEIFTKLKSILPEVGIHTIKAYRCKESFGDIDILLESNKLPSNYINLIETEFQPKELVKNGNCISLEYKEFQVDLIITPNEEFDTSANYFAYNDLGNLCGRISHAMGLKLGHDGLSYNWRIDTYQFKNEVIETDWDVILSVLGLDYRIYNKGFDTLEDIFRFVVSSPFFNKEIFQLHNRNNAARVRDRKRKTYMEFIKWIENYEETDNQKICAKLRNNPKGKSIWLPYLFTNINGFEETYNRITAEWNRAIEFKKRFNGELIKDWTGLSGKELGEFMKFMKSKMDSRIEEFILDECTNVQHWVNCNYESQQWKLISNQNQ